MLLAAPAADSADSGRRARRSGVGGRVRRLPLSSRRALVGRQEAGRPPRRPRSPARARACSADCAAPGLPAAPSADLGSPRGLSTCGRCRGRQRSARTLAGGAAALCHRAGRTWVRGNEIGRVESTLTSASSPGSTNTTLQPPEPLHWHSTCTRPSTHGASVGFLGLEGSCHRPRDRRGASRSQRQPAATLDARCEHPRQRGQLNPTQEPSAQRGDGWLEHAGRGPNAGLLGGIVPPVIVDEGMGARRHPAPVPRHGA